MNKGFRWPEKEDSHYGGPTFKRKKEKEEREKKSITAVLNYFNTFSIFSYLFGNGNLRRTF